MHAKTSEYQTGMPFFAAKSNVYVIHYCSQTLEALEFDFDCGRVVKPKGWSKLAGNSIQVQHML
jgi:hypothetical protein